MTYDFTDVTKHNKLGKHSIKWHEWKAMKEAETKAETSPLTRVWKGDLFVPIHLMCDGYLEGEKEENCKQIMIQHITQLNCLFLCVSIENFFKVYLNQKFDANQKTRSTAAASIVVKFFKLSF